MILKGFWYRIGISLREYGERKHKAWIVRLAVLIFFRNIW